MSDPSEVREIFQKHTFRVFLNECKEDNQIVLIKNVRRLLELVRMLHFFPQFFSTGSVTFRIKEFICW